MSTKLRSSFGRARPHVSKEDKSGSVRIAAVQMASGPNIKGNLNEARKAGRAA
jgi:hypothetical protein